MISISLLLIKTRRIKVMIAMMTVTNLMIHQMTVMMTILKVRKVERKRRIKIKGKDQGIKIKKRETRIERGLLVEVIRGRKAKKGNLKNKEAKVRIKSAIDQKINQIGEKKMIEEIRIKTNIKINEVIHSNHLISTLVILYYFFLTMNNFSIIKLS